MALSIIIVMFPLCSSGDELLGAGVNKLNASPPSHTVLKLSSLQIVEGSLSTQLEARSSRLEARVAATWPDPGGLLRPTPGRGRPKR